MIQINQYVCDLCGACIGVCPVDAIAIEFQALIFDHVVCIDCRNCVKVCPVRALSENSRKNDE